MRLHRVLAGLGLGIAIAATAGCQASDTSLRITVLGGALPTPSALRLTLVGVTASTRLVTPVELPGTLVVHGLPPKSEPVCLEIDGLDANLELAAEAVVTVTLHPGATADATVTLAAPSDVAGCPANLGSGDLGHGAVCPAGASFCDDFEADDLDTRWSAQQVHGGGSALGRDTQHVAHGLGSLHAYAAGQQTPTPIIGEAYLVERFAAMTPPVALRANVLSPVALGGYSMALALYDPSNDGFALGGDDQGSWVLTEDQASGPDHHATIATQANRWQCVELVVGADGMVSVYVDNVAAMTPFARRSATAYSEIHVGIERTVVPAGISVYVDDVALGSSRLGCP